MNQKSKIADFEWSNWSSFVNNDDNFNESPAETQENKVNWEGKQNRK